jgi:hypothetical protein
VAISGRRPFSHERKVFLVSLQRGGAVAHEIGGLRRAERTPRAPGLARQGRAIRSDGIGVASHGQQQVGLELPRGQQLRGRDGVLVGDVLEIGRRVRQESAVAVSPAARAIHASTAWRLMPTHAAQYASVPESACSMAASLATCACRRCVPIRAQGRA